MVCFPLYYGALTGKQLSRRIPKYIPDYGLLAMFLGWLYLSLKL